MPQTIQKPNSQAKATSPNGLYLIGLYKLFECSLLVAAGFGLLRLLHGDFAVMLDHWVHVLRLDPDNRVVQNLLNKAGSLNEKQLREMSTGTFLYAGLRFGEGLGLVMRKRWGEYLTVAATAVFIPFEIWELARHFTGLRVAVFLGNLAIVIYLIYALRKERGRTAS